MLTPADIRPRRRLERGFTMVELVVAMILMMLVVGGVVYAVTQLGRGNATLTTQRKAQRDALEALDQMRHDFGIARTPSLELFVDRREVLRSLIAFHDDGSNGDRDLSRDACRVGASGATYIECLTTVTVAEPNQVWFRANVDSATPAAECVGYVVSAGTLTRYVAPNWRTCNSGSIGSAVRTVLVKGNSAAGTRANAFAYTTRRNPALVPRGYVDPSTCASQAPVTRVTGNRAFISSIEINLTPLTGTGGELTEAGLKTSAGITAHNTGDYAYAMGCAA